MGSCCSSVNDMDIMMSELNNSVKQSIPLRKTYDNVVSSIERKEAMRTLYIEAEPEFGNALWKISLVI